MNGKIIIILVLAILAGCSAAHYRESADEESYGIIAEKETEVLGEATGFRLEPEPAVSFPVLPAPEPRARGEEETSGVESAPPGAEVLSLAEALKVASKHNRDYQSEREDLYLSALAASLERYRWGAILDGSLSTQVVRAGKEDRFNTSELVFGVAKKLAQGGEISAELATELVEDFEGDVDDSYLSSVNLNFRQPLLRGAGRRVAQESLVQAERNMVYAVRAFVRFRKTFFVSIADEYYRVLQQRQVVENEWRNYQNLKEDRARQELLAEAGRLRKIEVDQAKQRELQGRDRWVLAKEAYELALDKFKITLGLSTDTNLALDPGELDKLSGVELKPSDIDLEEAVRSALANRQDMKVSIAQLEDVGRKLDVARDNLRWDLDLDLSMSVASRPHHDLSKLQFDEGTYSAGVTLGFPLDRQSERNAYRQALINVERQKRTLSLKKDNIKLAVRSSYRTLLQARESYRIQKLSVSLAQKRVDSTGLMLQAGRAITRDLLEARDAQVQAENALTQALVDYIIAELEFKRDTGARTPAI